MNRRQHKASLTKKKISDAAIKLFEEKGFRNVTVDEIVQVTGTSKGAFYTHFKSKHEVFFDKFKEIDRYYEEVLLDFVKEEEFSIEKLRIFLRLQMKYIQEDLGWDVTRTIYENELDPSRKSYFLMEDRPLYRILTNIFDEGQKNGEFRNDISTEKMVMVCLRVMRGILYDWSINEGAYSLEEEQELLFSTMINGLEA
ncbi:TetR/AcrR family transcriptional regulator [Aquisalibacillus elongatus]|uniref:TetR family transcriptional regulator n=1 Tax=Aquisalibacillus elongatus TaxID=485577 RepID=A0A3N5B9Y7_9BACI|nr:TetR/AcrR family transcriptional regulator [Aquisalibacillus elongatus]RPF54223.1 TetR family transcriptional regulator [Aquisalibacillus elongatus]